MKSLIGRLAALTAMLALAAPSLAQAPANLGPAPSVAASHAPRGGAPSPPPAPTPSGAPAVHPLTADDVSAYLDGFMPYALARGNIAGAVVVVVKDGQPLFEKGYGVSDVKTGAPVDPATTLFRPGSVSVRIYRAYESAFLPQGRPFNRPAYLAYFLFWLDTDNAEICHRLCIKPDTPTDNWQIDLPQSVRQFLEFGGFLPR